MAMTGRRRTLADAADYTPADATPRRRTAEPADDVPRTRRRTEPEHASNGRRRVEAGGGFAAFRKERKEVRSGSRFDPSSEEQVIIFLDDENFASKTVHWIAKRPYGHIKPKEECPLCRVGRGPDVRALFVVVPLEADNPEPQVLEAGSDVVDDLELLTQGRRPRPLTDGYFVCQQVTNHETNRKRTVIKRFPAEELGNLAEPTDDEYRRWEAQAEKLRAEYPLQTSSRADLEKIARDLSQGAGD